METFGEIDRLWDVQRLDSIKERLHKEICGSFG